MVQMNQFRQKPPLADLAPLDRVGWLSTQPDTFKTWVAENGRWRRFVAGETLYFAGDEPNGLFGLGAGALDLTFPLLGDEPVTIHRAEPGFWIGEATPLAGGRRLVSLSPAAESRVFHIPQAAVRELLARDPACWRMFYEQSFNNVTTAVTLLAEALALSPRARLARLLLRLADAQGRVNGNQDDFGRLIGMTRSSVRRALGSLAEAGVLRTGYRWLEIADVERLEQISREA